MKMFTEAELRKLLEEAHSCGFMSAPTYDTRNPNDLESDWYLEERKQDIDRIMEKL